jgi:hypothetical protein
MLDFGLAKVRAAESAAGMTARHTQASTLTGEGTILGTLQTNAEKSASIDARYWIRFRSSSLFA